MLEGIFALSTLVFLVMAILGLIKPSLIKQEKRIRGFLIYLGASFGALMLGGFSAKMNQESSINNELSGLLLLILIILSFFFFKIRKKNKYYETKYQDLDNIEKEKIKLSKEISNLEDKFSRSEEELIKNVGKKEKVLMEREKEISQKTIKLNEEYTKKKDILSSLQKKIALYDDDIKLQELGFYKPHYDFNISETFKERISLVRDQQKHMLSSGKAIFSNIEWVVEGSKAKGKTMSKKAISLTARAFNNECDALIAKVNWNNIQKIEQRIIKSYESILKLNSSNSIDIDYDYVELKLSELRLTYEYKLKKQEEKEEKAEIRLQMREEVKFERELEKVNKEEDKYQKLLDKAQADAKRATGTELKKLQNSVLLLESELQEAHEKNQRAKSMAEQTKSGHVYVISNIGSFGEDVYKIGMTRRLEPLDRVKELGDASVPFIFDTHAMIYSENAPLLENTLHKVFNQKRVNLVNTRKEFFHVSLEEIEKEVLKISPEIEFVKTIEAKDYMESRTIRANQSREIDDSILSEFPNTL